MSHAPYQLLPDPAPDDLRRLTESIRTNGVEVAVVVDEDGNILDGHHRQMIADSLGLECPRVVKRGLNEHQKRIYAVDLNVSRRQLTDAQKVLLGQKIEPDIKAEAKRKQGTRSDLSTSGSIDPEVDSPVRTRDVVAEKAGIGSGFTYHRHKKVLDEIAQEPDGDELMEQVERGEIEIKYARALLKSRHNPSPPKSKTTPKAPPTPVYEVPAGMPSTSAAAAMLSLANLPTTNIIEAGDELFDMAKDIDAYLDNLPKIISAMKRVARRARHLRDKAGLERAG